MCLRGQICESPTPQTNSFWDMAGLVCPLARLTRAPISGLPHLSSNETDAALETTMRRHSSLCIPYSPPPLTLWSLLFIAELSTKPHCPFGDSSSLLCRLGSGLRPLLLRLFGADWASRAWIFVFRFIVIALLVSGILVIGACR